MTVATTTSNVQASEKQLAGEKKNIEVYSSRLTYDKLVIKSISYFYMTFSATVLRPLQLGLIF